jgi:hypothetical protein
LRSIHWFDLEKNKHSEQKNSDNRDGLVRGEIVYCHVRDRTKSHCEAGMIDLL